MNAQKLISLVTVMLLHFTSINFCKAQAPTYVWAKTNNGIYVLHGSNMKNTSIQVVDANGKTAGQILNNNSDAEVTIDLSKCDNGIFYVYIFENQKSKSIKLIKL